MTSMAALKKVEESKNLKIDLERLENHQFLIEGIEKKLSDKISKLNTKFYEFKIETEKVLNNHYEALQAILVKLQLN